jgi:hypothetical protein
MELKSGITYMQVDSQTNRVWRLQKDNYYINFDAHAFIKKSKIDEYNNYYIIEASQEMDNFMNLCIYEDRFVQERIPNRFISKDVNYEVY